MPGQRKLAWPTLFACTMNVIVVRAQIKGNNEAAQAAPPKLTKRKDCSLKTKVQGVDR